MPKKTYILFFLIIFSLFKSSFSTKKIMIIEGDNLDVAIKNSIESKFKLFLIFHVKNCPYCTRALKVLKEQIVKNFEEEEELFFGSIDLDNQLNIWLGFRFNITKIPYIILIENNKMYHFESQFEESLVLKFINEEKNLEDGENIPEPVTFKTKFKIAVKELTESMEGLMNKIGINVRWNNTMSYILLFIFFFLFVYIESKILEKCKSIFKFNKNNINNSEKKDKNEKKNENEPKINKEEKKIKKE